MDYPFYPTKLSPSLNQHKFYASSCCCQEIWDEKRDLWNILLVIIINRGTGFCSAWCLSKRAFTLLIGYHKLKQHRTVVACHKRKKMLAMNICLCQHFFCEVIQNLNIKYYTFCSKFLIAQQIYISSGFNLERHFLS